MSESCIIVYRGMGDIHGYWPLSTVLLIKIMTNAHNSRFQRECVYISGNAKTLMGMLFTEPSYIEKIYDSKYNEVFSNLPINHPLFQNFRKRVMNENL